MRTINVPVYIGVMKSTINSEEPIYTVTENIYSSGQNQYLWYRTELSLPIQGDVIEVSAEKLETANPGLLRKQAE